MSKTLIAVIAPLIAVGVLIEIALLPLTLISIPGQLAWHLYKVNKNSGDDLATLIADEWWLRTSLEVLRMRISSLPIDHNVEFELTHITQQLAELGRTIATLSSKTKVDKKTGKCKLKLGAWLARKDAAFKLKDSIADMLGRLATITDLRIEVGNIPVRERRTSSERVEIRRSVLW